MNCDDLKNMFKECKRENNTISHYNFQSHEWLREAVKYNCVLLSKEIRKQCEAQQDKDIKIINNKDK
jgi:hypothetical protein